MSRKNLMKMMAGVIKVHMQAIRHRNWNLLEGAVDGFFSSCLFSSALTVSYLQIMYSSASQAISLVDTPPLP